jgi:hypothetical protein
VVQRIKPWGSAAVLALLLGSVILGGTVEHAWWDLVRVLGTLTILRWLARWAQRRYQVGPGLRGFVPHKTPWAP